MSNISLGRLLGEPVYVKLAMSFTRQKSTTRKHLRKLEIQRQADAMLCTGGKWMVIFDGGVLGGKAAPSYGSWLTSNPDGIIEC